MTTDSEWISKIEVVRSGNGGNGVRTSSRISVCVCVCVCERERERERERVCDCNPVENEIFGHIILYERLITIHTFTNSLNFCTHTKHAIIHLFTHSFTQFYPLTVSLSLSLSLTHTHTHSLTTRSQNVKKRGNEYFADGCVCKGVVCRYV